MKSFAPPLAQAVAPKVFEESEERKKELAESSSPKEGGTTPPAPTKSEWTKLGDLDPVDLDRYREFAADPAHPFRKVAIKMLERWEKHQAGAGYETFSPDCGEWRGEKHDDPRIARKDPRGPSIEGQSPRA